MSPNVGLEPTTLRLRVSCSTDWASRAILCSSTFKRNSIVSFCNNFKLFLVIEAILANIIMYIKKNLLRDKWIEKGNCIKIHIKNRVLLYIVYSAKIIHPITTNIPALFLFSFAYQNDGDMAWVRIAYWLLCCPLLSSRGTTRIFGIG